MYVVGGERQKAYSFRSIRKREKVNVEMIKMKIMQSAHLALSTEAHNRRRRTKQLANELE